MNDVMKVSIIIPVYNAENTIKETIASISSTYDHEIICINDGSKDKSAEVISDLSQDNIVLLNRENKGAAATRNEGISIATGEYIMFCDADDKLGEGIIDKMVEAIEANNTDIVVGQISHLVGEEVRPIKTFNDLKPISDTDLNHSPEVIQSIGPYGKLYKKKVLENIRFDEDITFCEEHTFNLTAWANSKITIIDELTYLYNIGNEDSIVATSYKNIDKYLNDATKVRKRTLNILKNLEDTVSKYYSYRMNYIIIYFLIRNKNLNNATKMRKKTLNILKNLEDNVSQYYSYRMDYLIIYFLIRNNYLKTENLNSLLDAATSYLKVIKDVDNEHKEKLKDIVLAISTHVGHNKFVSISRALNMYHTKKTYRSYQMKAIKLKTKMTLRDLKNKNSKSAH